MRDLRRFALLLARLVLGINFLLSGTSAVFGVPNASPQAELFSWPYWWGGAIEIVVGTLLVAGLFTLIAGLIAAGHMAYAYLFVHVASDPAQWWNAYANGGLAASGYSAGFLLIALFGPGALALDNRLDIKFLAEFRY